MIKMTYNKFQGDQSNGLERLCNRLENLRIEYVHLRRFDHNQKCIDDSALYEEENDQLQAFVGSIEQKSGSRLFYANFVDNFDALKEFYCTQMLNVDNPMVSHA
jgi:hypothetical protein